MASSSPEATPALATSKRKFHKLLDNLTASTSMTSLASTLPEANTSTTSLPESTIAGEDPPPKRSRLSDDGNAMDKPRAVSGSDRIRALQEKLFTQRNRLSGDRPRAGVRSVNNAEAAAKLSAPRKEPNFQPYSQEQFLSRLKTYADVKKWTNKPEAINEVAWAKRGWVCEAWNTVACKGGCEQRVAVRLYPRRKDASGKEMEMTEDIPDEGVDEGLVERFRELVVNGHYQDCLWRKRGCMDDIYHIPIPNRAKSSAETIQRYNSLTAIVDELPLLHNVKHPDPSISEVLRRIPQTFFVFDPMTPPSPPDSPAAETAFAFALFGWSGLMESKIAIATCNHCFQRIGLWLYKDERLKEMAAQLEVPIDSLRLDLLEAHRDHCPWKNPDSQCNPGDGPIRNMAAWQTLEFVLTARKMVEDTGNAKQSGHGRNKSVATVASEGLESYRSSEESTRETITTVKSGKDRDGEGESLNEKWRKFKAKLKRTTSRKSLRSVKSAKSTKSVSGKDK